MTDTARCYTIFVKINKHDDRNTKAAGIGAIQSGLSKFRIVQPNAAEGKAIRGVG